MIVTEQSVAEHLPYIHDQARRYVNGEFGCEYDDLVQEASEKLVQLIAEDKEVTHTALINAMIDWVRYCRLRGTSDELSEDLAA